MQILKLTVVMQMIENIKACLKVTDFRFFSLCLVLEVGWSCFELSVVYYSNLSFSGIKTSIGRKER